MSKLPIETLKLASKGDKKAKSQIIRQYMPLVHKMVHLYKFMATGGTIDDLVQEGCIAINHALDTFNPPGEVTWESWMTWVYHNVRHGVQSAARKESRHIMGRYPKADPKPTSGDSTSNKAGYRGVNLRHRGLKVRSESSKLSEFDDGLAPWWLDPADSGSLNYDMEPSVPSIQQIIIDGCGSLNSKRAQIVCKRFGLMGYKPMKSTEIAKDLKMSKQSVSGYLSRFSKTIREKHPELRALIV